MLYLLAKEPQLHLHFCRLLTCFLYPPRQHADLLKGGKYAQPPGIGEDGKGMGLS